MRVVLEGTVVTTKNQQTFSQILFVMVALTSSTFVILVITRWTRRLKSLLQASERMSLGDFTVPIRDQLKDEVGHLSRSFSLMQDAVHSRGRQLRQFNENLERTIQERTHELSLRNSDLLREIQERERTEFSLRLLESAVNQITDAVMITTPLSGQRPLEIVYVNRGFTAMTGYEPQEVIGKSPSLLAGEKTDRALLDHLFAEPSAGRNAVGEMINYHKSGSEVLVEWNAVPLRTKAGEIVNLVAVQRDISQRKQAEDELQLMHRQLLDASRRAGMAEVATGVLHNVGNVLNSVNVSATLVCERLNDSRLVNLDKAVRLIGEHQAALADFLTVDPRGRQLPTYLSRLSDHLLEDRGQTLKELHSLVANIEHIKQIVSLQQSYGKSSGFLQAARPHEIIDEAVRLNSLLLQRSDVTVVLNYQDCPPLLLDKQKILQILVNLIANAQNAIVGGASTERVLTITLVRKDLLLSVAVSDTGSGIAPENLAKIFTHGFTTKKDGHGFGLHYCAIAAKEMQGTLLVESRGLGQGATFTLVVPVAAEPPAGGKAPGTTRYSSAPV
jgi:PAS domain S-box-containing protein